MTKSVPASAPAVITVLTTPACHFCEDAEAALAELAEEYSVVVERVDLDSQRGAALLRTHRPALYPLVLVDGAFFSFGRLPRAKLRKLLAQRALPVSSADR